MITWCLLLFCFKNPTNCRGQSELKKNKTWKNIFDNKKKSAGTLCALVKAYLNYYQNRYLIAFCPNNSYSCIS